MLEQYVTFRRIFMRNIQLILFRDGAVSIKDLSFHKNNDISKGQVMMTSYTEMEIEGDERQPPEHEPNLDYMA